jgi:hypothetical protein
MAVVAVPPRALAIRERQAGVGEEAEALAPVARDRPDKAITAPPAPAMPGGAAAAREPLAHLVPDQRAETAVSAWPTIFPDHPSITEEEAAAAPAARLFAVAEAAGMVAADRLQTFAVQVEAAPRTVAVAAAGLPVPPYLAGPHLVGAAVGRVW